MKTYALLIFLLSLGIADYAISNNPNNQNIGSSLDKMEKALENEFDCEIEGSHYSLIVWHQKMEFTLSKSSKYKLTDSEARIYLAANFSEFQYVDEFVLN